MPIRVIVKRDVCIGCGVAPALCPDIFILEDGRNRILDRFSVETNDNISVGKLPEDMLDCIENAVTSCPVGGRYILREDLVSSLTLACDM